MVFLFCSFSFAETTTTEYPDLIETDVLCSEADSYPQSIDILPRAISSSAIESEALKLSGMTIYNQGSYTGSKWALANNGSETRNLKTAGCFLFSFAHAYQWVTGEKTDDSFLIELIGACKDPNGQRSHSGCTGHSGSSGSGVKHYIKLCSNKVESYSIPSENLTSLRNCFNAGAVVIISGCGHIATAVEEKTIGDVSYTHIIDSNWGTFQRKGNLAYYVIDGTKITEIKYKGYPQYSTSNYHGSHYWIKTSDLFSTFAFSAAIKAGTETGKIGDFSHVADIQVVVTTRTDKGITEYKLQDEPYAAANTKSTVAPGTDLTTTGVYKNKYDNYWLKFTDGTFLCANDVVRKTQASEPTASGLVYPKGDLPYGEGFNLKGTITSSSTMPEVWAAVYKAGDSSFTPVTALLTNVKTVDILNSALNVGSKGGIRFGSLAQDNYHFTLWVYYYAYRNVEKTSDNPLYRVQKAFLADEPFSVGGGNGSTVEPEDTLVSKITISNIPNDPLYLDDYWYLDSTVEPATAVNKTLKWSSSNPSVISVDQEGRLEAIAKGSATITATATDGSGVKASVTISCIEVITAESLTVNTNYVELEVGESERIIATITPSNITFGPEWWSDDESVATVSADGVITAVGLGSTEIRVSVESWYAEPGHLFETVWVDVIENRPVTSITLNTTSISLDVGDATALTATISPSNATNKSVTWSTSNSTVATVDNNGGVTAKGPGTATIYAAANDGSGKSDSCTVTVTQPVTGISLNTSTLALNTNGTANLTATVSPSNASNKTVTWKSSDTTVATVDSNGKVTAKGPGSATITATAADGSGKKATCTVTVTQLVTGITLNPTSLALDVGASSTLIATVSPSNASNKAISWSSGNTAVATVDSNGKVTAKAPGTAVITASAHDGSGVYATCSVTVTQPVMSVTLDQHSAAMIVGDAISLTATVKPDNVSNKAVTWSSSNSSVAAVDANGTVTAKTPGSAVITVAAADGSGCSDACTITVEQPVVSISLTPNSATMNVGDIVTVAATISPANASNKAVKWSSSTPSVATVSANGTINAVSWGTATIQCTAEDGYGARAGISIIVSGDVMTNPDMVLPAATTLIEDEAFMGVAATSVKLPDSLVTIGARAFANCKQLTQVYIPRGVTSIHTTSFDGTSALVIYGYRNSYAEEYAAQYGYTFVQLDPVQVILPTEITISGSTVLNVNSTAQLQAVVSPDNVTDDTVTWSSSDTSVATVDQNGLVTAISKGYVAITATAKADPRITASWSMEVKQPVRKITISGTTTVKEGATAQLTATVEPADANCKAVTWTSSNTSVATVNSSGVVTAINAGTTVITATATDGSNISGKVTITVSPATFSVNFDANGGSCSTSSITATRNAPLGNLPTATRDYYRLDGWYTAKSDGSEVTADTVYSTASNVTLYAHWTIHPESGWVLESQVPAGAQITATSWSYTESTESTSSTMSGWTPNGSYWKQTGTGSKQYASFPGGYDTSNVYYTTLDKSPYTASETATAKREVVDEWAGYIYWHWMYSCTYTPSSTANRTISTTKQWASAAGASDDVYFQYFFAMASTVDCKSNSTTSAYSRPSGLETWNCSSIIPSLTTEAQRTSKTSGLGTDRFYRFSYYTSTYTDYEKVFKYYRVLEYQTSDPGNGENITEKTKYVKYREK